MQHRKKEKDICRIVKHNKDATLKLADVTISCITTETPAPRQGSTDKQDDVTLPLCLDKNRDVLGLSVNVQSKREKADRKNGMESIKKKQTNNPELEDIV